MENIMQQTANRFWQTHFPDLMGQPLTEQKAIESNFWENLQVIMEDADADVAYAVLLSNLAMRVETSDMYTRIKRIAKWAWDKKHN